MPETAVLDLQHLEAGIQPLIEEAKEIQIVDQNSYNGAANFIRTVNAGIKRVEESIAPHKTNAYKTWKDLCDHETRILNPAKEAKLILSKKIIAWDHEQERIRAEEQRRINEENRKREEEERINAAIEAEADGAGAEETAAILSEPLPAVATIAAPTYQRASGISRPRENWKGECTSLLTLICHIAGVKQLAHPELLNLIQINQVSLNQIAKSQKQLCNIPGVRVYNDPNIAVR